MYIIFYFLDFYIFCITFVQNSNCCPNTTVHVDAFLYDDDEVDDLEKEGKLKRYYCRDCGSKNIEPLSRF